MPVIPGKKNALCGRFSLRNSRMPIRSATGAHGIRKRNGISCPVGASAGAGGHHGNRYANSEHEKYSLQRRRKSGELCYLRFSIGFSFPGYLPWFSLRSVGFQNRYGFLDGLFVGFSAVFIDLGLILFSMCQASRSPNASSDAGHALNEIGIEFAPAFL